MYFEMGRSRLENETSISPRHVKAKKHTQKTLNVGSSFLSSGLIKIANMVLSEGYLAFQLK